MEKTYLEISEVKILMNGICDREKSESNEVEVVINQDPREEVRIFELGTILIIGDKRETSNARVTVKLPESVNIIYY